MSHIKQKAQKYELVRLIEAFIQEFVQGLKWNFSGLCKYCERDWNMGSTLSKNHDSDVTTQEEISEQNKGNEAVRDSSKQETPIKPAEEPGEINKERGKPTFWAVYSNKVINH